MEVSSIGNVLYGSSGCANYNEDLGGEWGGRGRVEIFSRSMQIFAKESLHFIQFCINYSFFLARRDVRSSFSSTKFLSTEGCMVDQAFFYAHNAGKTMRSVRAFSPLMIVL